jgi:chemotaxis protein methyltransferase CheR
MAQSASVGQEIVEISPESFAFFAEFITRELGIKMSEAKLPMLQSRLLRRLRALQLSSLDEYRRYLAESPDADEERIHFISAITTNKTDFFREPQHYDYLVNTALPKLYPEGNSIHGTRITAWSAGCSSGEEPYTLAMVLNEYCQKRPRFDFAILATDISNRVLQQAKSGTYEESRIEPVSQPLRAKYLLRSRDRSAQLVRVVPELRQKVSFHCLNFMDRDYRIRAMFDVIFFRNVMIYFDRATQGAVVNRMCRYLRPGGYLFVGHSESLTGLNVPVTSVTTAILRKQS